MSSPVIACPECGSLAVKLHVFSESDFDAILKTYYPRAHDCNSCGNVWDQAHVENAETFRKLLLASVVRS